MDYMTRCGDMAIQNSTYFTRCVLLGLPFWGNGS